LIANLSLPHIKRALELSGQAGTGIDIDVPVRAACGCGGLIVRFGFCAGSCRLREGYEATSKCKRKDLNELFHFCSFEFSRLAG
jgi:hypothetical protein